MHKDCFGSQSKWLVNYMPLSDDYETIDRFFRLLVEKHGRLEEEHYRERGLTKLSSADLRAVQTIGKTRQERMTNLAKHLRLTVGTLTTTIDRLVAKGYVSRHRQEDDRRVVEVRLSQKGKEVFEDIEASKKMLAERIFEKLNSEERVVLKDLLAKLVK